MILDSAVERLKNKEWFVLLSNYTIVTLHPLVERAYPLYSTPKHAYRLTAKLSHRVAMTKFLDGALDVFECTLKRVLLRSLG